MTLFGGQVSTRVVEVLSESWSGVDSHLCLSARPTTSMSPSLTAQRDVRVPQVRLAGRQHRDRNGRESKERCRPGWTETHSGTTLGKVPLNHSARDRSEPSNLPAM